LTGSRSVLSRAERIAQLADEGKFDPQANSPFGLPKVRVRHSRAGQKAKKEAVEGADAAAPAAAAPAAKGAAPAAKGAAPAAKGAAPAAKGAEKKPAGKK